MASNQKQSQPPTDKGRAKAIAANSRFFEKAYGIGALRKPGRKAKAVKPKWARRDNHF